MKMKVRTKTGLQNNIQKAAYICISMFCRWCYFLCSGVMVILFMLYKQTAFAAGKSSTFFAPKDLSQTYQMADVFGKQI